MTSTYRNACISALVAMAFVAAGTPVRRGVLAGSTNVDFVLQKKPSAAPIPR